MTSDEQWTLLDKRDRTESLGVIPAKGWTHRAVVLTGPIFRAPCKYDYVLKFSGSAIEEVHGTVEVPEAQATQGDLNDGQPALQASVLVERDAFEDHLLVRLLITNNGNRTERVWISGRDIDCKSGKRPGWSTKWPVPQGQDIGPAAVKPADWAVLVGAIDLANRGAEAAQNCSGSLTLSRRTPSKWVEWKTIPFALVPHGYLGFPDFADP